MQTTLKFKKEHGYRNEVDKKVLPHLLVVFYICKIRYKLHLQPLIYLNVCLGATEIVHFVMYNRSHQVYIVNVFHL